MSGFAVVNPHSGGGRTGREWPQIRRRLSEAYPGLVFVVTAKRGDATRHVREALNEGHSEIIAIGGDGTINEAVNRFFDACGPVAPDAVLAFLTSGTGGDFRRSFGIPANVEAAVSRLVKAPACPVDVGRLSCVSRTGRPVTRHFVNIGSFGLSGAIVASVNRSRIAKQFGGTFAFAFHSVAAMLTHRERIVRIRIDSEFDETAAIATAAVANGQYFGGGMRVAPQARPDDGLFDIVLMDRARPGDLKLLYRGEHLGKPGVRLLRGRRIIAAPVAETRGRPVLIEVDGESAGRLPATFEILPGALNLRC